MKRVHVRVSLPMEEALLLRSEESDLPLSTVASNALRGALQRTIDSPKCAERIAKRRAEATRDDWMFDREEAIQPRGESDAAE